MAKRTGTMTKVGDTLKAAAGAVAEAAETYVVEPVGQALGLTKPRAKGTAKKTAAGRALTAKVAKAMPKAGAKRTAKEGPGPKAHQRHPKPVSAARPPKKR